MRNLIGIIALLIANMAAFGNTTNVVDPELKVMAKSGLKLRLSPNLDAPVLDVIRYGETVTQADDFVPSLNSFKVNWVKGSWIKVNYNKQEGFIFNGFVSDLAVPSEEMEFASTIGGLSQSLYNWAYNNYDLISTDTLTDNDMALTTLSKLNGNDLFVHDTELVTRVEFTIDDIRIMDAYHLLESMMDTRSARSIFKENTMFFAGADGNLNKIKVAGGQIQVRKLDDGRIKVSCQTIHEGC